MRGCVSGVLFACLVGAAVPVWGADKPNVLIVLTDDQGYGDLSCHGNPVLQTPNLDRLAERSVRLTDFHVAPMCTPTRAQLMTGRDALDTGATFVCQGRSMVRAELPTVASIFQDAGYRTGLFGKWHLGDSYPYRPLDRGFQEVVNHGAFGITSIPDFFGNDYFDDTYLHNGVREKYTGYCTNVWFEQAIAWMSAQQSTGQPFLAYIPTNVPHAPEWVDDRYSEPYQGRGPANFFGMIANLDENMGRLVAFLEERSLAENTVLIFATDNGTASGDKVFNAGMRGIKRSIYDGGHRVPCFVRWPAGGIDEPREIDVLAHCQDLLPTLIELCGVPAPEDADFDGVSLAALLRGETETLPDPNRMLVVQYKAKPEKWDASVLWNKWRLVNGTELYRVDDDPGQAQNIAGDHPDVVQAMRDHYEHWWADVQQRFDEPRPIHIGSDAANPMMLYSCDWHGDYADNFFNLAPGDRIGAWDVIVDQPGRYTFTLWRWPPETDTPLDAPLTGPLGEGKAVPITQARLSIGDIDRSEKGLAGAASAQFTVDLEAGPQVLRTWFHNAQDEPVCSAYYLRAERLTDSGR